MASIDGFPLPSAFTFVRIELIHYTSSLYRGQIRLIGEPQCQYGKHDFPICGDISQIGRHIYGSERVRKTRLAINCRMSIM
jgi:hypothetical protein